MHSPTRRETATTLAELSSQLPDSDQEAFDAEVFPFEVGWHIMLDVAEAAGR